ncbi:MAG TPA: VOC family protein [Rhizomicrobium sp.]|nr:VOC family protein [Rhizomicrobium sp.]
MKLGLALVIATDLARAEAFYGGVLGLVPKQRTTQHLVFAAGPVDLTIFQGTADAPPARHGETAATVFVFEVPYLDATIADLKAKGVPFLHTTPATGPLGRYAAFRDPFGNVLELLERG